MVKRNIHGRMGAGMFNVFGATLAATRTTVETIPAKVASEIFVFMRFSFFCKMDLATAI
jgi:hypothetical protein